MPAPIRESRPSRETRPLHETSARDVGERVGREHQFAASRGGGHDEERHPERPRATPAAEAPPKPALDGAKSLREALAQVTNKKSPEPRQEELRQNPQMPNLKETLWTHCGRATCSI